MTNELCQLGRSESRADHLGVPVYEKTATQDS